ncbi:hypothetical protein ACQ33O_00380 [Ferruginibacter sp. SUN002]|uniref:hypothetical protein n=1 Tax=Ferruginibacter sp. SUN002 TaxID=2937789 RepID=UPI003D35F062
MIENTKITLSAKELELVCNREWILTKHAIIEKVYNVFGNLSISMQTMVNNSNLSPEIKQTTPKISKGENYLLLPYVMLDYPRYFEPENTFAIRTFFWWGKSMSIHLLISGNYQKEMLNNLITHFAVLQEKDFAICVAETPWQHHFEKDNYVSLKEYTLNEFAVILHRKSFVKIGRSIALEQWDEVADFLLESFSLVVKIV